MDGPRANRPIPEAARERIEQGQVFLTAPRDDDKRERTGAIEVIEPPDDHPDAQVRIIESWDNEKVGNTVSMSPQMFVARAFHLEFEQAMDPPE